MRNWYQVLLRSNDHSNDSSHLHRSAASSDSFPECGWRVGNQNNAYFASKIEVLYLRSFSRVGATHCQQVPRGAVSPLDGVFRKSDDEREQEPHVMLLLATAYIVASTWRTSPVRFVARQ